MSPGLASRASGPSPVSGRGVAGQYRLPLAMMAPWWVPLGPRSFGCRSWTSWPPAPRSGMAQAPGRGGRSQALSAARAPVEHGFSDLKHWRILTRLRLSPARATTLLRALLVLTRQHTTR